MEIQYDDARVTLGDGKITVEGMKVAGSRSFCRDPRLSHLAQALADLPPIWKAPRQMAQVALNAKWCSSCGDVRPKSYFSPKQDTYDGLDHRCKECENERKRRLYAQEVGHPVRPYARREKVAV